MGIQLRASREEDSYANGASRCTTIVFCCACPVHLCRDHSLVRPYRYSAIIIDQYQH